MARSAEYKRNPHQERYRVMERQYDDITSIERVPGQLRVTFKDGLGKVVPSFIGDLDQLSAEIESRRSRE